MAATALPRVELDHAQCGFLVAAAVAIDRDRDSDRALPLHALDVMLGDFEFVGGIKLRPDRPAARRDHVGHRRRGLRRQDHQMIAGLGGAGDAFLTVGMIGFMAAGRIDDDRRFVALAEDFRRHVDLADIDQSSRPQLEFQKSFAVGAQGHVIVDARRHVAEMGRRHVLVHHRLEIEHVERLLRARDQMIVVARRPDERIGRPLRIRLLRQRRQSSCRRTTGLRP